MTSTPPVRSSPSTRRLVEATAIKLTPFIPHVPHPKQQAFLWLDCKEALYGGSAGGGKSDALLMAALQYVDVPGYAAILFRKTMPELRSPDSLIPKSQEWLAESGASWNDNNKQWTFPSGATLNFGFMKTDEDRHRYQSAAFQFIGFDELTHFSELQYTYMASRCRRPQDLGDDNPLTKVPLRIRGATNPGSRGHLWVKERFITKEKDPPKDSTQRIFIPAYLKDNPSLDKEAYEEALLMTDESTRAQLLEGSWDAREPGEWVIPDQTFLEASESLAQELWDLHLVQPIKTTEPDCLCIDWGEHTQAYVLWPLADGGVYVPPSEIIGYQEDPVAVTIRMLEMAERLQSRNGRGRIGVARYDAAGIQSMRSFAATARKRPGWERLKTSKIPFNKYKKESIGYLRILLRRTAAEKPTRIIAIHPDNVELLQQLRMWKFRKVGDRETEDIEKDNDHGPDALLAGISIVAARHRAYVDKLIAKAKEGKNGSS